MRRMERRDFIKLCAASAVLSGPALAADATPRSYARARLVDEKGAPLKGKRIPPNTNLIFHYPYASTPCFLLNLGKPAKANAQLKTADNRPYVWTGGVGAQSSIVAYSAICAHQMTYPTRDISFISFRPERSARNKHASVIHCCSEHSQYDPAEGGRVVAGPAPQPLAAIMLDYDARADELYAVGTLGGEMFNDFFKKYAFKLEIEHGGTARAPAGNGCVVQQLDNYCKQQVKC
jgi:Rieske Fe-S protein